MGNIDFFDVVQCEKKICQKIKIEEVANKLMQEPESIRNKRTKWNITYKTFYKDEKTASLKISESLQIFHCFATNHTGNAVTLYKDYRNLPTLELACKKMIEEFKLELDINDNYKSSIYTDKEKEIIKLFEWLVKLGHYNLKNGDDHEAKQYLENRKFYTDEIDIFNLGYLNKQNQINKFIKNKFPALNEEYLKELHIFDESGNFQLLNRIIFPIYDLDDNVIALSGRDISSNPEIKYKNIALNQDYSNDFPNLISKSYLYNLNRAKHYIPVDNELIIVEGFFDVIRLNSIGVNNVAAILTTDTTYEQEKNLIKLHPNKLTVLLDGDTSGITKQTELLNKLSSMKNKGDYKFKHTFFFEEENYIKNKDDPDSYFMDKTNEDWRNFKLGQKDYRVECIKKCIAKYEKEASFSINELYEEVGNYIISYSPIYIEDIKKIIIDRKKGDYEDFCRLFKDNDDIQSLYLMNRRYYSQLIKTCQVEN